MERRVSLLQCQAKNPSTETPGRTHAQKTVRTPAGQTEGKSSSSSSGERNSGTRIPGDRKLEGKRGRVVTAQEQMTRNYTVFGPILIPRNEHSKISKKPLRDFWQTVRNLAVGLPEASGCYIFGTQAARGTKPWYVGQAKKSFKNECFTDHKINKYNDVLDDRERGIPILFLLARMTPRGRFQTSLTPHEANKLEDLLIRDCLRINNDLSNSKGTAFFREAVIPGLLNNPPGRPSESANALRCLLGLAA